MISVVNRNAVNSNTVNINAVNTTTANIDRVNGSMVKREWYWHRE